MSGSMDSTDTASVETVAEVVNKHDGNSSDMEIKDVTVDLEETSELTDEKLQNGSVEDDNDSPEPIITEVSSSVSGKQTPEAEARALSPDRNSITNEELNSKFGSANEDESSLKDESIHGDDAKSNEAIENDNEESLNDAHFVSCKATIENNDNNDDDNKFITGGDDKHSEAKTNNNPEETLHESGEVINPVDTVHEVAEVGSKDDDNEDVADGRATVIKEDVEELNCTKGEGGNGIKISDEDKEMIINLFKHFDSDETGAMSIAELGNFMRAMGMFPTDDEVEDLLTHMDQDKSGMVDLTELIKQMASQIQIRKESDPEHDFKEAFLLFDKDGNGKISRDELVKVLTDHGTMKVTTEEAEDYIAMVDTDDDGMMNYSEFVTLFTQKIGI